MSDMANSVKPFSGLVKGVAKAPEIDEEDMNIVFTTNVTGLINMTQAILPIFQKRPDGGQGDIINIGSIAGMLHTLLCVSRRFDFIAFFWRGESCDTNFMLYRQGAVSRRFNLLRQQGGCAKLHRQFEKGAHCHADQNHRD